MSTDDPGRLLHLALVAAYEPYLERTLAERGWAAPDGWPAVVEAGRAWLDDALEALLTRPYRQQDRGALEVFQEAMRFPTRALAEAGVEPPARDAAARAALPGDEYGLAPASSQALGEEVWEAHIAWGASKAASFRPVVGLLSRDLMDRSRVEPVVEQAGFRLSVWRDLAALEGESASVALALVDLAHPVADESIRVLADRGVKTVAYGPHVDDMAMVRSRSLGAADALPRSAFFRNLRELLPTLV